MEIVKNVNIFLSIFGYRLDCDPKESNNQDNYKVVDKRGLIVGSLEKSNESSFNDAVYMLKISSINFGNINGQVFVLKEKEFTKYTFPVEIKGKEYENSPFCKSIGEMMEIQVPNLDCERSIEISNRIRLYDSQSRIILEFCSDGSDRTISFSTLENRLRIYSDSEGNYRYKASNSLYGEEIQVHQNGRALEYSYNYIEKTNEATKVSGSIEISDEDTPVEAMCKSVASIEALGAMHLIKDPIAFVRDFRRLCHYDEDELCIFNNIASITLGEYTHSFSESDMKAIFGFVPWKLPSTPIVNEDGTVTSPRDKGKQRSKSNHVAKTLES